MNKWIVLALMLVGCDDSTNENAPMTLDAAVTDSTVADASVDAPSDTAILADIPHSNDQMSPRPMDEDTGVPDATSMVDVSIEADMMVQPPAPTIWTGPRLTFEKPSGAAPDSPEAQDRITDSVVLTRGDGNVLFNIALEASANAAVSPRGTLWAEGTADAWETLEFTPLREAANNRMQDLPGKDMVLLIVEENIYIDVRFISWRSGRGNGGGFSYARSTPND